MIAWRSLGSTAVCRTHIAFARHGDNTAAVAGLLDSSAVSGVQCVEYTAGEEIEGRAGVPVGDHGDVELPGVGQRANPKGAGSR